MEFYPDPDWACSSRRFRHGFQLTLKIASVNPIFTQINLLMSGKRDSRQAQPDLLD